MIGEFPYTYRECLKPNKFQESWFKMHAGMRRAIYNNSLAYNIDVYNKTGKFVFKNKLIPKIPLLKSIPEFDWLNKCESSSIQQAVIDFDTALHNHFNSINGDRKGRVVNFPKFKKKGRTKESFRIINNNSNISINRDTGTITLPKLGEVKVYSGKKRLSRIPTHTRIKNVTISRDSDNHWYVSICMIFKLSEYDPLNKYSSTGNSCGIDMGVKDHCTIADYDSFKFKKINLPKRIYKLEQLVEVRQREYSRKLEDAKKSGRRFSDCKNLMVAKTKLSQAHARIKHLRRDFQHQLTHQLAANFDCITIETLDIQGMLQTASDVTSLARDISRQGWYQFQTFLKYKLERSGKICIRVSQYFPSSQFCSTCKFQNTELKNKRSWRCPDCGTFHDRDVNAAYNLSRISSHFLNTGSAITTKYQYLQLI